MYKKLSIAAACAALATSAQATTQLDFTQLFVGGVAYNFANAGEMAGTNGLTWGLIADIDGDGFDTGSYVGGFDITTDSAPTTLKLSSGDSDDLLYVGSSVSGDSGFAGGGAGTLFNTTLDIVADNASDSFAIVWFDSRDVSGAGNVAVGDRYGIFTDASFTLPATDGGALPYDSVFNGMNQGVKTADFSFQPTAVPEPSSTALLGLGSLGLLLRRRR